MFNLWLSPVYAVLSGKKAYDGQKSRISFVLQALFRNFGYNRKPFENKGSSED